MAQLLCRRPRIEIGIEGQGREGWGMGAGDAEMAHQQMADHRLGPGQSVNAGAGAVGDEGLTLRVFGEAGHGGDGGGTGRHQLLAGAQQGIGPLQRAPAAAARAQAQTHPQGHLGGDHRTDRKAQGGAAGLGRLQLAGAQLRFDPRIQQQPHPPAGHRCQRQLSGGEAIEGPALHVVDAAVAPIEGGAIHHIGMGDQAAAGRRQQPGRRQAIARIAPHDATHAGGDHQQGGQGRGVTHWRSGWHDWPWLTPTPSSCRPRSGSTAVIAQRSGSAHAQPRPARWAAMAPRRSVGSGGSGWGEMQAARS